MLERIHKLKKHNKTGILPEFLIIEPKNATSLYL